MLQPTILEAYESDPEHPIRLALEDNDLLDWAPQVPTKLLYCIADDQVNYQNSIIALQAYQELGSTSVEAMNMGPYNHGFCAPFAMYEGYNYFETFRAAPFEPVVEAIITGDSPGAEATGSITPTVEAEGNWTFVWSNGSEELNLEGVEAGIYDLAIISEQGCQVNYSFEVETATSVIELSNEVKLYPNPVLDELMVESTINLQSKLYDISGRVLMDIFISPGLRVDLSDLAPGMYILVTETGEKHSILKQ